MNYKKKGDMRMNDGRVKVMILLKELQKMYQSQIIDTDKKNLMANMINSLLNDTNQIENLKSELRFLSKITYKNYELKPIQDSLDILNKWEN